MEKINIKDLLEEHGCKNVVVEKKDFGTIYRTTGLSLLDQARITLFSLGHDTPISCHREEGSCEAFMIIWAKNK